MSAVPKPKVTPADYLEVERKAEIRSEYFRGEMFAMAGASRQHNTVTVNLIGELHSRLKGSPCRSFAIDQRVKVSPTGLYTYPDIVIVCGQGEYEDAEVDTLLNPEVIVEVLSPSTENYDRGAKFRQYQQLLSLKEYILVSQDEPLCERFVRQSDGTWNLTTVTDISAELAFNAVPVRIPLAAIYDGVTFAPPAAKP